MPTRSTSVAGKEGKRKRKRGAVITYCGYKKEKEKRKKERGRKETHIKLLA